MPMFVLPDPGEGLVEAEIVTWMVKVGDEVKTNDIVVEVETAKSLVELPIPYDGLVRALLAAEGDTVEVGAAIIDIDDGTDGAYSLPPNAGQAENADASNDDDNDDDDGDVSGMPTNAAEGVGNEGAEATEDVVDEARPDDLIPAAPAPQREANLVGYGPSVGATTRRRRKGHGGSVDEEPQDAKPKPKATPPVRKYAKDRGVDLAQVQPTRDDDVISRADVDAFVARDESLTSPQPMPPVASEPRRAAPSAPTPAASVPAPTAAPTAAPAAAAAATGAATGASAYRAPSFDRAGPRETRTPVKGVRRLTANAMVASAFTAPHVTEFITVDVSATMELVERLKGDREFRDLKVSPLLILAKALIVAVHRNPGVNAAWDEAAGEIVQRHYLNLGIAAATPRGLIVPNIKDADLMDLAQLAAALQSLVVTAKAGRVQLAQMSGGTITITNVGVFGVDTGTPIINPGESAIVCFGAVRRQPWVVTARDGSETIEPRWITQLAVSFDHRLVDGELGSRFLADIAALMHDPGRALVWG